MMVCRGGGSGRAFIMIRSSIFGGIIVIRHHL